MLYEEVPPDNEIDESDNDSTTDISLVNLSEHDTIRGRNKDN